MRLWQQGMIFLARNATAKKFMQRRATMSELSTKFVGGKDVEGAAQKSVFLKKQGYRASLFYLGEYVNDLTVVEQTVVALKQIAKSLAESKLDVHISVDPTQIGHSIDPRIARDNAFTIAEEVKRVTDGVNTTTRNFLMLDMEDSSVTDFTVSLYESLQKASLPRAVTLQAYLHRTEDDLRKIIQNGGAVRLVKGAFAERKEIAFTSRPEIDGNYLKMAGLMLSDESRRNSFYPIFGTHDDRMIDAINKIAERNGWKSNKYEFEMLFGVRTDLQQKLIKSGAQLRLYLPFGEDWWPYAVRRIGESPKMAKVLLRALFAK